MTELIRVGDLISITKTYHPAVSTYGNILELMDFDDNTHDSIILITGQGDENTKLKVKVKWFAEIGEEYSSDIDIRYIKEIDEYITTTTDTHSISVIGEKRFKSLINGYQNSILKIKNKMNFLEKNRNIIEVRDEKISIILD
jgi:L-fucose mutarotase/ribose pyranase (RbsD/FucU family)|tara:strand:- start:540 stop:965 length:426 start_codon:yes stop_codon:yes gene_type:complete